MRTAGDTATLAVVYVLTHMVVTESKVRDDSYYWEEGGRFPPAGKQWNEGASAHHSKPERAARSLVQFHPCKICNYYTGRGHWKAKCPVKLSD